MNVLLHPLFSFMNSLHSIVLLTEPSISALKKHGFNKSFLFWSGVFNSSNKYRRSSIIQNKGISPTLSDLIPELCIYVKVSQGNQPDYSKFQYSNNVQIILKRQIAKYE